MRPFSEGAVELFGLFVSRCPDLLQLCMYVSYFQSLIVCLHFVARGDFCPGTSIAAKGPRSQPLSEWGGMVLKFPKCTVIYFSNASYNLFYLHMYIKLCKCRGCLLNFNSLLKAFLVVYYGTHTLPAKFYDFFNECYLVITF